MIFKDINKINPNFNNIIGVVLPYILIIVIIIIIIWPSLTDIKAAFNSARINSSVIEKRFILSKYFSGQVFSLANLEKYQEELNRVFIDQESELDFITTLENIAHDNNLKQNLNLVTDTKNKTNINQLPLQISLEGDYDNLMIYLEKLESLSYYVNIEVLEFVKKDMADIKDDDNKNESNFILYIIAKAYLK